MFYAPLLVRLGETLARILETGVQVLPQQQWEARERNLYEALYRASVRIVDGRTLLLPCLGGTTLAALLEDRRTGEQARRRAIALAVAALAAFHAQGFTHGDAMAENVLIDLDAGAARWFDFETVHDANRPAAWRRADDVRALLATCLLRAPSGDLAGIVRLVLDSYADQDVTKLVTANFRRAMRRPLIFHLGQAGLSYRQYREIARVLSEASRPSGVHA
jgi:serine/threonine protein kinase